MSWQDFYLVCFVLGFVLAAVSFLAGAFHWPVGHHWHLPHAAPLPHAPAHAASAPVAGGHDGVSPFNFASLMTFLAWFGGVGYLLAARGTLPQLAILGLATAAGVAGASVVFAFLTRFLLRHEREVEAADYRMTGVLGRVTVPIRAGGTGEIVYSQAGTRRSAGARGEEGAAIGRGLEVVVTRYEKGIAYVRPWEELAGEEPLSGIPRSAEGVGSDAR